MVRLLIAGACVLNSLALLVGCDTDSGQSTRTTEDGPPSLSIPSSKATHSQQQMDGQNTSNRAQLAAVSRSNPEKIDRTPKKSRALLIGCTQYDNPQIRPLRGPVNDVDLMRDVLIDKFNFQHSSIVILSEKEGRQNPDLRPTGENIVRQFENLAEASYADGAHVVILFSGHGGRQPDTNGDEVDGFDEVFCPADVVPSAESGGVESGGISDDDIHGWLDRISERASVWLIADSCHNGTLTRGGEADGIDVPRTFEPSRGVAEESHRENPASIANRVRVAGVERSEPPANNSVAPVSLVETSRSTAPSKAKHPIVAFYAAPPTLETYDTEFNGVPHGLFTYTMCKVIRKSSGRLSYRKLIQGVFDEYTKQRRESPTPQIEAVNQDIEVLGHDELLGSDIQLLRNGDGYSVTAGRLRDVTAGTILAVYSGDDSKGEKSKGSSEDAASAGDETGSDKVHGYVRVISAEMLQSRVEPCAYRGVTWKDPTTLTDCYCEIESANFQGLRPLAVAVDRQTVSGQPLPDEARKNWEAVVNRTNGDSKSLVRVVEHSHQADWIVQVADASAPQLIYVAPAKRFKQQADGLAAFITPLDRDSELWLQGKLDDIARTCNLVEIAKHELKKSSEQIDLDVQLRWRGVDEKYEETVDAGPDLRIDDGSQLGVYIRNPNPFAVYVTVLFVNSNCQTKLWLPRENHPEHRLEKSGKKGDWFLPAKFTVSADTAANGLDKLVVIAVKERKQGQQADLTFLASRTWDRARGKGEAKPPLEQLLAASVFGISRDAELQEEPKQLDDHTFRVLSWQAVKKVEEGKGLFGGPKVGPPEDLGAAIVQVEAGKSQYHTADSPRAFLGTYGELTGGKVPRYEPYTQVAEFGRIRSFTTIDKVGRASGNDLLSIAGHGRAWEILNFSGEVTGEHERQLHFEVVGTRLDQADLIDALERDRRAMRYFSMLMESGGVPCVIMENITLPRFEATRKLAGTGSTAAEVRYTENGLNGRYEGERISFVAFRSPVIRAYQMYQVKLAHETARDPQGRPYTALRVKKLEPIPPKD